MASTRGPGQRAGLSRAAVLAAARELLEQDGEDALSVRAVARRLGVAPNAIYSHVDGRAALVDGVLDDLLGKVPAPAVGRPAPAALAELLLAAYDLLVSHPWLVSLYLARQGARGENAVRLGAVMDERLAAAGVAPDAAADARRVLLVHLMGSAAFAASSAGPDAGVDPAHARALFTRSLDWLLAGLVTPA